MTTPIRPSLAQLLNPQAQAAPRPITPVATSPLRQILAGQTPAPATYKAAEINAALQAPKTEDMADKPLLRPGSLLNIRV